MRFKRNKRAGWKSAVPIVGLALILAGTWTCRRASDTRRQANSGSPPSSEPPPGGNSGGAGFRIFFSDLDSGPNIGGENGMGVYVTIYGRGFGQPRGASTVTIGGGEAAAYPIWTDTKIALQLGPQARTGNIVVHTSAGDTNGVPFTVRDGRIYFVGPGGRDGSSGEFGNPWRTIQYAIQTMAPGDTVYAMDGLTELRPGSSDGSVEIASSGLPGRPKTLAAYPGATVTIGSPGNAVCNSVNCVEGLVTFNVNTPYNYWTIAGLKLRGNNMALEVTGGPRPNNLSTNWRVVGNDMSCPYIHSESGPACVTFSEAQYIQFYGNTIHDVGQPGDPVQEYGQGLYFTTDTIHVDAGWNTVANIKGCRGVQVHSSPLANGDRNDPTGYNQYDIIIHDNLIHDCACDGLLLWSVDPSQGPVKAYNNVIYNAGNGPKPRSGSGFFSCIYMAGVSNNVGAPPASGTVDVINNTLYNCGIAGSPDVSMAVRSGSDSSNTNVALRFENNIIDVAPDRIYTGGNRNPLSGSKNLWFGAGPPPANGGPVDLADNLNADPLFVNAANADFHLQADSPARDAGVDTGLGGDKDGVPRSKQHIDLGAYQFAAVPVASLSCQPAIIITPATISCSVALTAGAVEGNGSIEISGNLRRRRSDLAGLGGPHAASAVLAGSPAPAGSILTLFTTGLGQTDPIRISARVPNGPAGASVPWFSGPVRRPASPRLW